MTEAERAQAVSAVEAAVERVCMFAAALAAYEARRPEKLHLSAAEIARWAAIEAHPDISQWAHAIVQRMQRKEPVR